MVRLGTLALGAVVLTSAAQASAATAPRDVVRGLYAESSIALSGPRGSRYFARDLAAALQADSTPGEIGAIGFDYRYGAQDVQIRGLEFIEEVDGDRARVVAVFKNFGRPNSVDWTLCRRPNGEWRILDATSNTGAEEWALRAILSLPADRPAC